jgi:hypothetical protein
LSRWFNERAFVNEYGAHTAALQEELWRTMLAVRAEVWDRFIGLVRSDGERVALRASVWFLTPILAEPPARQAMVEEERAIPPRLRELLEGTGAFGSGEGGDAA